MEEIKEKQVTKKSIFDFSNQTDGDGKLIVYNDDYNSFDFVISTFMQVCFLSFQKAKTCASNIHEKGCDVILTGNKKDLEKKCNSLIIKGINAIIE